ncbi:MAG: LysM peptidoglycan-binding domain-containing protein, partial [Chloroflexi bacterium]
MTSPAKPSPEGEDNATVQRLAVAGGAFLIIVLTVIAAIFLAQAEQPETPVAVQESPAIIPTPTPFIPTPTPASLASPTPTSLPPITPSPSPEPAVDTPTPPPTATQPVVVTVTPSPTPVVIVVTPTPGPPQPTAPPSEGGSCQPPASWVVYTVQEGDTLNRLAERTGSSVRDLQKYNCLKSFTLTPGQTIYLPEIPPTPTVTPTASATPLPQATPTPTPVPLAPQIDQVAPSQVDRAAADAGFTLTVTGKNFQPTAAGVSAGASSCVHAHPVH